MSGWKFEKDEDPKARGRRLGLKANAEIEGRRKKWRARVGGEATLWMDEWMDGEMSGWIWWMDG